MPEYQQQKAPVAGHVVATFGNLYEFSTSAKTRCLQSSIIYFLTRSRATLAHLPHEHRNTEALPGCLTWEQLALALGQMPTLAVMLRVRVREEACP